MIERLKISIFHYLIVISLTFSISCHAENKITSLKIHSNSNQIFIEPQITFTTNDKIKEAIDNGIRIQLIAKSTLFRPRSFWFDEVLETKKSTLEVYFFTMGKLYVVKNKQTGEQLSFNDYDQLWHDFQEIIEFRFNPDVQGYKNLWVNARIMLDKSALPTAMQLPVLFDSQWDINTEWFEQKVSAVE